MSFVGHFDQLPIDALKSRALDASDSEVSAALAKRDLGLADLAALLSPAAAGQHRRQIGENVAVQVAGHHHVEAPRRLHEFHRRRVHQFMVGGHIGVVGGHFLEHPVVQGAPERLGIAFGDQAYLLLARLAVGAVEAARAV